MVIKTRKHLNLKNLHAAEPLRKSNQATAKCFQQKMTAKEWERKMAKARKVVHVGYLPLQRNPKANLVEG